MLDTIIQKLLQHESISAIELFSVAKTISQSFASSDSTLCQDGRNLLILVLDNWNVVDDSNKYMFEELIESAGFYPYIDKMNLHLNGFDCNVRNAFHRSHNLLDRIFHSEQKIVADLINSGKNVVVSAPTSFGKSLLIEEIIASQRYKNIVIIQPTLALLDETRNKLKKYDDKYKIIVRTSQTISKTKNNVFLLTAERVLEYQNLPQIDLFILDEFYKLSNKRNDNRSSILNNAFLKVMHKNPKCQFYFLGPNIDAISDGFTEKYHAVFFKTAYSMVVTQVKDKFNEVTIKRGGKVDEKSIFNTLDSVSGQTLIFCSSPSTARKLAFAYCQHLHLLEQVQSTSLPLMKWIDENISYGWSLCECLNYKIGIHDGAMPKHITSSTIKYFNSNMINFLFCTNTIIEGVNTSAKNVVYYDNKIGTRAVDYFDYSNIRGRAGRLMEHFVGNVINLKPPPPKEVITIDLPFYDQNPIEEEVLVNLNSDEVRDINDNTEKYEAFHSLDPELQEILKRNAVSIQGQKKILEILESDLNNANKRDLIVWSKIDKQLYKRLEYLFNLCWDNLATKEEQHTFPPKGIVINKVVSCCYQKPLAEMIKNDIEYRVQQLAEKKLVEPPSYSNTYKLYPNEVQFIIDDVIEKIFAMDKNWFQYRAPKWINVVDSLQKYLCKKKGIPSGNYAYVAEMIENNFVHVSLRMLSEYGLPISTINKIEAILVRHKVNLDVASEEDILLILKNHLNEVLLVLTEYEGDVLSSVV